MTRVKFPSFLFEKGEKMKKSQKIKLATCILGGALAMCSVVGCRKTKTPSSSDSTTTPTSDVSSETQGTTSDVGTSETSTSTELLEFTGVEFKNVTVTYDGKPHTIVADKLPDGTAVTYIGTDKYTDAGTYEVKVKLTKEGYNDKELKATLTINKATYDMSGVTLGNKTVTYNGNAHAVELAGDLPEGVTSEIKYYSDEAHTTEVKTPTNAGTYYAVASFASTDANYEAIDSKTATLTINKATIDVSGVVTNDLSVCASGNEVNYHALNVPNGVNTKVEYYTDEAKTNKIDSLVDAGTYYATVSFEVVDALNYNAITETRNVIIEIKENNTGITFNNLSTTYDGTTKLIEVDMTNKAPEGNFTVTYYKDADCTEVFEGVKNAGSYQVFAKIVDSNNFYPDSTIQTTLTIEKKQLTVTAADATTVYNQNAPVFDYNITGFIDGEDKTLVTGEVTYTTDYTVGSNVGSYVITPVVTGLSADNYSFIAENGELVVTKADFDLGEIQMSYETYNKQVHTGSIYGDLPDSSIVASFTFYSDEARTVEVTNPTNAGTYYVVVSFTHTNENYNEIPDNNTLVMTIKPKTVYLNWDAEASFVYDGKTSHTLNATITSGVIDGDTVTVHCSSTTESPIRVGEYVYTAELEGADSGNYIISEKYLEKVLTISAPITHSSTPADLSTIEDGTYAIVTTNGTEYFALTNQITGTSTVKTTDCSTFTSVDEFNFTGVDVWTITNVTGGITIKTGDKYLSYNSITAKSKTGIKLGDTEFIWTVSNGFITGGGDRYLLYNGSNNASAFGYYTISSDGTVNNGYANVSFYAVTEGTPVDMNVVTPATTDGTVEYVSSTGSLTGLYSVDTVTLTITPVDGKMVKSVKVGETTLTATKNDDGTYTCIINGTVGGDVSVEFADALAEHKVTIVSPSGEVNGVHSTYYENETVTFTITPAADKYIKNVIVTQGAESITVNENNGEYSFVMGKNDVTITVEYGDTVALTFEPSELGETVLYTDSKDNPIASGTKVNDGTTINVTANPVVGYSIDKIFVNDVELTGTSFVLNGTTNVRVTYKLMDVTSFDSFAALTDADKGNKYLLMGRLTEVGSTNCFIEDLNGSTNTIQLYNYNNPIYTAGLAVGDVVVVYGEFTIYNSTYELTKLTIIDSIKPVTNIGYNDTKLVWSSDSTTQTYSVYKDGTLVSSDLTVKELDLTSLGLTEGTTYTWKIEANSTKTGIKSEATATLPYGAKYTLTYNYNYEGSTSTVVNDLTALPSELLVPAAREGFEFVGWFTDAECTVEAVAGTPLSANTELFAKWKVAGVEKYEMTIKDYATSNSWVNGTKYTSIDTGNSNLSIEVTKTGSYSGKYYTSGNEWRFYQTEKGELTISNSNGNIVSVTITYNISNSGVLLYNGTKYASGTKIDINSSSAAFTVGNSGTATNGQVKITKITIEYSNN